MLEAANPDGLDDLKAGKTISLGNRCRSRLQKPAFTILSAFPVFTGGCWEVDTCGTVASVAKELSAVANKEIHPYDVNKYNLEVNPAHLRPGTILVVPLARGK